MTAVSCLAIGLAFAVAVSLLVFAGALIGWVLPRGRVRSASPPRGGGPRDPRVLTADSAESANGRHANAATDVDPPETGG